MNVSEMTHFVLSEM